jgi:hypothetical protein
VGAFSTSGVVLSTVREAMDRDYLRELWASEPGSGL